MYVFTEHAFRFSSDLPCFSVFHSFLSPPPLNYPAPDLLSTTFLSRYCSTPFAVEPVDVVYQEGAAGVKSFDPEDPSGAKQAFIPTETCPRLSTRTATCPISEVASIVGVELDPPTICELCTRMQLGPASYDEATQSVAVTVPPTRSDILHHVDIVEDVAIAYGFNKLIPGKIPDTLTVGTPLPINHFCDQLRDEVIVCACVCFHRFIFHSNLENFTYSLVDFQICLHVSLRSTQVL